MICVEIAAYFDGIIVSVPLLLEGLEVAGPEGQEDVVNAGEQLIERGRAQGLEGLRKALEAAATARGLVLSEFARARVVSCTDTSVLTQWLVRAVTASTESEIFVVDGGA